MWSRILETINSLTTQPELTTEMCAEIGRLGLQQSWFQELANRDGVEFAKLVLASKADEAKLFEEWYPRLREFAETKRRESPFPNPEELTPVQQATLRILEEKVRADREVLSLGPNSVAMVSAPLHVLPMIIREWPSVLKQAVFLTAQEWSAWQEMYYAEVSSDGPRWFVYYDWYADVDPGPESEYFSRISDVPNGSTAVVITESVIWGPLAGGRTDELWVIDTHGRESLWRELDDITY